MEKLIVFIFGAIIGSFLNVCIHRIPRGGSVIRGRSFCPSCGHKIAWFDNVPLVSFVLLKGACRWCAKKIPVRYPLVELVTGLLGVLFFSYYSLSAVFFVWWFFGCLLLVIVFVDLEHQEIPDIISVPGAFAGLVLVSVFRPHGLNSFQGAALNSVFGVAIGAGSMFLLGALGEFIFKKEALGGGDVKLMGMIGAFLGWKLVILTFFLAPLLGVGVGIFMRVRFHREVIPYGPYLSLAAIINLLYGNRILACLFPV